MGQAAPILPSPGAATPQAPAAASSDPAGSRMAATAHPSIPDRRPAAAVGSPGPTPVPTPEGS
eukprot:152291-Alexandrium_andersonii.AAC.1